MKAESLTSILPQLLGSHTNHRTKGGIEDLLSNTPKAGPSDKFRYCQGNDEGEMIGCDNTEWCFHTKCLQINTVPRKKWYCPDCRKLPKYSRRVLSVIQ